MPSLNDIELVEPNYGTIIVLRRETSLAGNLTCYLMRMLLIWTFLYVRFNITCHMPDTPKSHRFGRV